MRFNPFNPQQPARPDFFVGRQPEVMEFTNFLGQTINNSPMNMAITGNRGMGKTSALVKFEEIAKQNNCLVVRLSNYEGNVKDIATLAEFIEANLRQEILSKSAASVAKDWLASLKPTISWKEVSLTIERQQQVVQELLRTRLVKIWVETKKKYKAIVVLIDEAESLEKIEGALTFLREVFQRVSAEANYMIVLAGKLNFPERMSESFSPLNRFFPVHTLHPFNEKEIREYVKTKLQTVSVEIDDNALEYIKQNSEGHPYVLAAVTYIVFDALKPEEKKITKETVARTAEKIKGKLAQDFFAPMYHPLTPKAKKIACTIAKNANGLEFAFKDALKWTKTKGNYLSPYLLELIKKGILNKTERAKYQIFHTLFRNYLRDLNETPN